MTLDERLELAKKYYETFGENYGKSVKDIIKECEKLKVLGYEWGEVSFGNYGKINHDFKLLKNGNICNSNTKYAFDTDTYYIHWDNGNVGRLQFLYNADYSEEETKIWDEFKKELMAYNPLDYDHLNDHIIYDIENGKKLMNDYTDICHRTSVKFDKYRTKARLEEAKREYEKLLAENKEGQYE